MSLARLVAAAFVPEETRNPTAVVRHRDGDLDNCHADNLRWALRPQRTSWDDDRKVWNMGPWRYLDEY